MKYIKVFKRLFHKLNNKFTPPHRRYSTDIKGINNKLILPSIGLHNVIFQVYGNNNIIEIKDGCYFNDVVFYISGNGHKILIDSGVCFSGEFWMEENNGLILIGKNSSFEKVHLACIEGKSIKIGEDCMFSSDIDVRVGDSHTIVNLKGERINHSKDVKIGNHVWVGSHVSILKGVELKDNTIVATRAVVSKSYDKSNVVIAGIPAIVVKENINWVRPRI